MLAMITKAVQQGYAIAPCKAKYIWTLMQVLNNRHSNPAKRLLFAQMLQNCLYLDHGCTYHTSGQTLAIAADKPLKKDCDGSRVPTPAKNLSLVILSTYALLNLEKPLALSLRPTAQRCSRYGFSPRKPSLTCCQDCCWGWAKAIVPLKEPMQSADSNSFILFPQRVFTGYSISNYSRQQMGVSCVSPPQLCCRAVG